MTPEQAKELIPIVTAYSEGKMIQARWRNSEGDVWEDLDEAHGFLGDLEYRIKPEPREFYAVLYPQAGLVGGLYDQESRALFHRGDNEVIRVREVI